ncbi:MAG TPA: DUF61 family protein [Methanomicrobia archaeon]|nr:DUF61 family protein [Methanomicrobia archaeon]HEX59831.1 DUF61 family protein [Methanomicrobia archaeon]
MTMDEKTLVKLIRSLNKHLPERRKSLATLLQEDAPRVYGRDGSPHRFKKEELRLLASILPEELHDRLFLPIYIEFAPDYGRGAARIHGRLECEVVSKILGKNVEQTDEMIIYRPEVRELRRKLPTTTQYAFFFSL